MIIWLNGAFGAGKTTIAEILHSKLANSYIYDPENIGDFLRHNLPQEIQKSDFQEYVEWRQWNVHMLRKIYREYSGDIIVPMTLYKQPAFDEIFEGLKKAGLEVHHFQLEVSKKVILDRLQERNQVLINWGTERVDEIITAFQQLPLEEKINNEKMLPNEVAQLIIKQVYN
ncbi:AAA family ATPase [Candidatus Enterococcus ferrettii]|uniref:AAA family ATPase n=1 Tax=Candidatus Enterococcus ferrettii TaxID=2815324 RepID=UPI001A9B8499|nr:AAA family ATPase [Enterococcus sp. 665A]MBO1342709.1 AAA family ATPase [Enterococcus sp. 665A]